MISRLSFSLRMIYRARFFTTQTKLIKWTIIDEQDKKHPCQGKEGDSVLDASINSGFQFQKVCGGNAECLTCHVHIPPQMETHSSYEPPTQKETEGIMFAFEKSEYSRLACQMVVTQALQDRQLIFKGQ